VAADPSFEARSDSQLSAIARLAPDAEGRPLDELVEDALRRITRLAPHDALSAAAAGALIIDIRSEDARKRDGILPGSLHIPRTVLEWRLAPDSSWRNPHVGGLDQQLILICDQGYSSILAAGTLVDLGFRRAGDVIGGFEAWSAAGLPVEPRRREPRADQLPGMAPPD
jgi:rhodanese-related sulfurtransferase